MKWFSNIESHINTAQNEQKSWIQIFIPKPRLSIELCSLYHSRPIPISPTTHLFVKLPFANTCTVHEAGTGILCVNLANTTAADTMTQPFARTSASMTLSMQDQQILLAILFRQFWIMHQWFVAEIFDMNCASLYDILQISCRNWMQRSLSKILNVKMNLKNQLQTSHISILAAGPVWCYCLLTGYELFSTFIMLSIYDSKQ